jgi:hypothetical protein
MHDLPTTPNATQSEEASRLRRYAALVWTIGERLRKSNGIRSLDELERYLYDQDQKVDLPKTVKKSPMP